jgi:hypothetical protein
MFYPLNMGRKKCVNLVSEVFLLLRNHFFCPRVSLSPSPFIISRCFCHPDFQFVIPTKEGSNQSAAYLDPSFVGMTN